VATAREMAMAAAEALFASMAPLQRASLQKEIVSIVKLGVTGSFPLVEQPLWILSVIWNDNWIWTSFVSLQSA
jgi:hypothetical protein